MSRKIKFRAWLKPRWDDDEDANKMYYDIQNSYDTLGDVKPYDPMDSFDQWLDDDTAIVEQYTGLADKNGKEIYEGDIVEIDKYGKFQIIWNEWACKFDFDKIGKREREEPLLSQDWEQKTEVIGNIHENQELIERRCNELH